MILKAAQWSFLLLIFSLPLTRPFNINLGGTTVLYTDLIFLFVFTAVILAILLKQMRPAFDRIFILIGIYAIALTIAVFGLYSNPIKLLGEYYLLPLCWIAFTLCSDRAFFRKVLLAWLCGTMIAELAAIVGVALFYSGLDTQETNYFLSHIGSLPGGHYPRVQGPFANPNMFCNYLNVSVCFLFLTKEAKWVKLWMLWTVSVAIAVAAAFTLSPGLGGIALSLGFLLGSREAGLRKPMWRTAACAMGIILATVMLFATLVSLGTVNPTVKVALPLTELRVEPSVRVLVWKNVIERTAPDLRLGRGTGAATADLAYTQLSGERQVLADAHNMYLNVMGQAGLVGLAAFVVMVLALTRRCRLNTKDAFLLSTSCAFGGAFLYQGLTGSFEDARHLWVLIGLLIAASRNAATVKEDDAWRASTAP